jgi:CheY-specific phosphatase CheX
MAVGEISNIIFGVFKYRVGQKGFSFNMVVPNVAVGSSRVSGTNWTLVGKFTSAQGDFTVLLSRGADLK